MVYSDRPLFKNPTGWLPGTYNPVDANHGTVSLPSGEVLSVQPGGYYETRPAGTAGPYEIAERAGDKLIYAPAGSYFVIATAGA